MSTNKKINYDKLNFILSVVGFVGSLTFYFGVLREINNPKSEDKIIQELQQENKQLKSQTEHHPIIP